MNKGKKLGIWMDHSSAHLIEFSAEPTDTKVIQSSFTHEAKEDSMNRSENVMHNKEQHQQSEFYKKLGDAIRAYDEVLLFGPTEAKTELLNALRKDHLFEKIKITVRPAEKMTENQQNAFVRDYFSHSLS